MPADPSERVVRVLPDVSALRKLFDYTVPSALAGQVRVGTQVRIALGPRRVGGWVVEDDVEPAPGVALRPVATVRGWGPPPAVLAIATWAAWRWAGPVATFLRTASSARAVRSVPPAPTDEKTVPGPGPGSTSAAPADAASLGEGISVVRLGPAGDPWPWVLAAATRRQRAGGDAGALVLVPGLRAAAAVARRLRASGTAVALLPDDWAMARAGGCVVVERAAAFAPVPRLAAAVVLDAHDEAYHEERAPTWAAWAVVADAPGATAHRARWSRRVPPSRSWLSDRSSSRPVPSNVGAGPWSRSSTAAVTTRARGSSPSAWCAWCARSRASRGTGSCASSTGPDGCGSSRARPAGSWRTARRVAPPSSSSVSPAGEDPSTPHPPPHRPRVPPPHLRCRRCGAERPVVCAHCGATRMKALRLGVTRVGEDLEALTGVALAEVWGPAAADAGEDDRVRRARVVVGTEAALHRVPDADVVAFLEFDSELLAPRFRAAEQALGLLARAARLVSRRDGASASDRAPGRVVVQTRQPRHPTLVSAVSADPGVLNASESGVRLALGLPPFSALALVSGPDAEAYGTALRASAPASVEVSGPLDGTWSVRAPDHGALSDLLATVPRPPGRLRVEVDPVRS